MTQATAAAMPRAKTAADENFPVGSLLISSALRPRVMAFYRFARLADDIADSPTLEPAEKLARLEALGAGLRGEPTNGGAAGLELRAALSDTGIGTLHAQDLLEAFKRDAAGGQCWHWADLMTYCRFSAAPVGRFMLALHGEDETGHEASDALCAGLQILNHVQDCSEDWRLLRRSYIPISWLLREGLSVDALADGQCCEGLRNVLDMVLDGVDDLIETAAPLPSKLKSRRLRLETSVILELARSLAGKLRRRDPIAHKVTLNPMEALFSSASGIARGLRAA